MLVRGAPGANDPATPGGTAPSVRLCVADDCNEAEPPFLNDVTGNIHAPSWLEQLLDGEVTVRLELVDERGAIVETLTTVVAAKERCGCRGVNLTVNGGALIEE